jgi:predicted Zn-dependent peptidase
VASYRYLDTYLENLASVGPDDVRRVANAYLIEDARTVGAYDPVPSTNGTPDA